MANSCCCYIRSLCFWFHFTFHQMRLNCLSGNYACQRLTSFPIRFCDVGFKLICCQNNLNNLFLCDGLVSQHVLQTCKILSLINVASNGLEISWQNNNYSAKLRMGIEYSIQHFFLFGIKEIIKIKIKISIPHSALSLLIIPCVILNCESSILLSVAIQQPWAVQGFRSVKDCDVLFLSKIFQTQNKTSLSLSRCTFLYCTQQWTWVSPDGKS